MKKRNIVKIMLFGSIVLSYVGCGSSNSSDDNNVNGIVTDGPIYKAKVCVDYNFNEQCDADEPSVETDINGRYSLKNIDLTKKAPLIVEPQASTIDTVTGEKFTKKLSAPLEGDVVNVNPITTLVGAKMYILKQENNLTDDTLKQVKNEVATFIGTNSDNLVKIDVLKDPTLYAKSVALSSVLADNFDEVKIDLSKLDEGIDAITDQSVKDVIQSLNEIEINTTDIHTIQKVIETSIIDGDIDILSNQDEWEDITLKNTILDKVFFKSDEDGLNITFNSDNSFIDFRNENGNILENTGTWAIEDGVIKLTYENGDIVNINDINIVNPYIYEIQLSTPQGNFLEKVLALPKDTNLSTLAGITPFVVTDVSEKNVTISNTENYEFYSDFTFKKSINGIESNGTWSVEGGVLDLNDSNTLVEIVRFDEDLFILETENGIKKGYIVSDYKVNDLNKESTSDIDDNVKEFLNSLDFTPMDIDNSFVASHKFIDTKFGYSIYLTSDNRCYFFGKNGFYKVDNNVLIIYSTNGEIEVIVAFHNLSDDSVEYSVKFFKNEDDDEMLNSSFKIDSFDEDNFTIYPSYEINGTKVEIQDGYVAFNFNGFGNIQFNIKDNYGNGVQCTTNYISWEDFNNAFNNNELVLSGNDISCIYEVNHQGSVTTQTETIKFINNQDYTYQVHMIDGYFSSDDYNITAIDASIIGIDGDSELILVDNLVAGKISFEDSEGNKLDIPSETKIRITPQDYQVDGDWRGVNCIVSSDGSFGERCYIDNDVNITNMLDALESNTSQIVVYNDENNNIHWDSDEAKYYYNEKKIDSLQSIDITINQ